MQFVVKTNRLKNYLYSLGFDFKQVSDNTGANKYVYLFPYTDLLEEALNFYSNFHKKING